MTESSLNAALRQFEAAEANLVKTERVWDQLHAAIPDGIVFGGDPEYDDLCRTFSTLIDSLPAIDGNKPEVVLMGLDEIAQQRLDAEEIGEIDLLVSVGQQIDAPMRIIREYRYLFNQKRRQLVRDSIVKLIDEIDANCRELAKLLEGNVGVDGDVNSPAFESLRENVAQINTLLGSSMTKPSRWSDLVRHARFGAFVDLRDIISTDWPTVRSVLLGSLYEQDEPVPVEIKDLGTLVNQAPSGPVATKLQWERLSEEDFERLLFVLISSEPGYENPEWLTRTRAADRGRDLSVFRVHSDSLAGFIRNRVIIQCKHWLTKSVAPSDVATLRDQMSLWEPPRVDVCVIATSGRFTTDAVDLIENHNRADRALRIEMWPESHLELLLANRPALIAEYSLR